jgi:hypothetical protein
VKALSGTETGPDKDLEGHPKVIQEEIMPHGLLLLSLSYLFFVKIIDEIERRLAWRFSTAKYESARSPQLL